MKTEKKCVALIGFMATGKTTIGSLLARELEYDFVDTDALVEAELGMKITDFCPAGGRCLPGRRT